MVDGRGQIRINIGARERPPTWHPSSGSQPLGFLLGLCSTFPFTRELQGWSSGPFVFANLLALVLCVYAFVIAKAGQSILGRDLIKE
jgi:hypothetical protein